MKLSHKTWDNIIAVLSVIGIILLVALYITDAEASWRKNENHNKSWSDADARSKSDATANSASLSKANAETSSQALSDASNQLDVAVAGGDTVIEGDSLSISHEARAPDIVLVPNNNTESCLRIWGLSFSNQNGGGGLGIPHRSKKCDFEQAADDAFAQGQMKLGWFWKCKNRNLAREFKSRGMDWNVAENACHRQMMALYEHSTPEPPQFKEPPVTVNCEVGQHAKTHKRIFEACQGK